MVKAKQMVKGEPHVDIDYKAKVEPKVKSSVEEECKCTSSKRKAT